MDSTAIKLEKKSFAAPDATYPGQLAQMDEVRFGDMSLVLAVWQPGWRWSEHVGAKTGRARCPGTHFTYFVSGHFRTEMEDGTILDCGPGDVLISPPGHDAWVLGDEPVVGFDFQGASRLG